MRNVNFWQTYMNLHFPCVFSGYDHIAVWMSLH